MNQPLSEVLMCGHFGLQPAKNFRRIYFACLILSVFASWNSILIAQADNASPAEYAQAGQLTPEQTLLRYQPGDLQLSPDGSTIAFTVTEPVKGSAQRRNIWLYSIADRELFRFTTSDKSDRNPRWSPDGKSLAFLSNRKGETQIYLISTGGGEAAPLTESTTGIGSFEWSPDGRFIAFTSEDSPTDEEKKKEEEKDDARVVDFDERHERIRILDVQSLEVRALTGGLWRISGFVWSRSGDRLIVSATDHPQPELFTDKIYSIDAGAGSMEHLYSPRGPFGNLQVSPDGRQVSFVGSRLDGPTSVDLYFLPVGGGETENITARPIDRSISSYRWNGDGSILALIPAGFTSRFVTIFPDSDVNIHGDFPVWPGGDFVRGNGLLAFVGETATQLPELWISRTPGSAEKVSDFNGHWSDIPLREPEIITYISFDGMEIEAAVLKPEDYREGIPVPAVVLVHGGPSGRWSDRFDAWGQLLAAHGFAVLYPNIRGSTAYGHDFLIMNRRDWGGGDFRDVMAGADFLIESGIADPERIGIGGWSYGGYMAAWAVTQTERFKASVSGAPMTDLAVEYGSETNSINAYDTWYLGTPYENLDLFIERSPMTHVRNVITPTLILCGENDVIDPIQQCQQFYRGLKRYGVETRFVMYPREGHGIREEKHRLDVLNRMLEWFETHLK
ncbi:S9 family peptidase [candidate division KSB1 bacterium]